MSQYHSNEQVQRSTGAKTCSTLDAAIHEFRKEIYCAVNDQSSIAGDYFHDYLYQASQSSKSTFSKEKCLDAGVELLEVVSLFQEVVELL